MKITGYITNAKYVPNSSSLFGTYESLLFLTFDNRFKAFRTLLKTFRLYGLLFIFKNLKNAYYKKITLPSRSGFAWYASARLVSWCVNNEIYDVTVNNVNILDYVLQHDKNHEYPKWWENTINKVKELK